MTVWERPHLEPRAAYSWTLLQSLGDSHKPLNRMQDTEETHIMKLSETVQVYPRSGIRVMFDLAEQYPDAIALTVGQPNFITPQFIRDAAFQAMNQGMTGYVSNAGIYELREVIANKYTSRLKTQFRPDNVMIAAGGMEALFFALAAIANPGDEILVPDPGYPNYLGQIALLRAKAVPVPLYEKHQFKLQPEDLERMITPKSKAIYLNYPSNPTGAVMEEKDLKEIAAIIKRHDLIVISDEVYDRILFDGYSYCSIASLPGMPERTIIVNSISKTYAMTGWRLGYLVADFELIGALPQLQEALISCVPGFVQMAAVAAISGGEKEVELMRAHYARRRDLFVDGLNKISGFRCTKGSGAFYAFANIKAFGKHSLEFAKELMAQAGVIGVPGSAFGAQGEGYIRFSYANSDEHLKEALARISAYVQRAYPRLS